MRKFTAATLAVTAVISAGAGAAAASAAGPSPAKSWSADRSSIDQRSFDRHSAGTARDASRTRDPSLRHDRSGDRSNAGKADR